MKKVIAIIITLLIMIACVYYLVINVNKNNDIYTDKNVNINNYNGIYNKENLRKLNNSNSLEIKNRVEKLEKSANEILKVDKYQTVTDKKILIAKGETEHDFVSMAPYLWSDNNSKSGYIVKDGVDNKERLDGEKFDETRLDKMVNEVNTLSLAYAITKNEAYADKAVKFLDTWFINPKTKMAANMKYAEIFVNNKGQTYFSGSSMISAMPLLKIVNDIYFLEGSKSLDTRDLNSLKEWFKEFNEWLLKQNGNNIDRIRIDNHGTWLQAEIAEFSEFSGNSKMAIEVLKAVGPYSICPQIKGSGKIPSALIRTKSVDYTAYNLEAFITLGEMGEKLKVPVFSYVSPYGGSIIKATTYLNNYFLGKEKWPYQNIEGKNVSEINIEGFIDYLGLVNKYKSNNGFSETIKKYENKLSPSEYLILKSE